MWISKHEIERSRERERASEADAIGWRIQCAGVNGQNMKLEKENIRLRADLDWFKLRLNHVELERAQLIQAAIGVKVSVPQFVPADESRLSDALNEMPDLSTIGNDAKEDDIDPMANLGQEMAVDYSQMPGYGRR